MTGPHRDARTRIKICGVTNVEIAEAAIDAGADALGFVCSPSSPRAVIVEAAEQVASQLPPFVTPVGVFVISEIDSRDVDVRPDWAHGPFDTWSFPTIQLHGEANRQRVRTLSLRQRAIRAVPFDPERIKYWESLKTIDALLVDSPNPGGGEQFDHDALAQLMPSLSKPVILAGGLTPENVGEAILTVRPWGVDVSSGVESSRGVKDAGLIRAFCQAVREADAAMDAK